MNKGEILGDMPEEQFYPEQIEEKVHFSYYLWVCRPKFRK